MSLTPVQIEAIVRADGRRHFAFYMEMGCVAGDTLIETDKGPQRIDRLARQGRPIKVWAMTPNGAKLVEASCPWSNAPTALYRVTLASGRSVTATRKHRLLTARGWIYVADLVIGERLPRYVAGHPQSIAVPALLSSWQDALRSTQTVQGSLDHYSPGYYPGDARPLSATDTAQSVSPLQADALERSHLYADADAWEQAPTNSHPRHTSGHLAMTGSHARECPLADAEKGAFAAEWHSAQSADHTRNAAQCVLPASLARLARPSRQTDILEGDPWDVVVSVTRSHSDVYYDLWVPHYENYLAQGMCHHNCGKTLAVLREFKVLKQCRSADKLVVVAPNSFKSGWAVEIEKHKIGLSYAIHESGKALVDTDVDVLIVNYEALLLERVRLMIASFIEGKRGYIAFDESIKLKNRKAETTKKATQLSRLFTFVRLLSGKPITQGPHDLWAQLDILQAAQHTFYGFQARFCLMGGWQGRQVVGALNADLLAQEIAPVCFQAKKKDWLAGLPPKLYTTRRYEMTGKIREQYELMKNEFVAFLQSGEAVTVQVAIAKYEKLSQIQCGFIIDEQAEPQALVPPEQNPRLQLLLDLIENEVTGPVIIVYRHRAVGEMLMDALHFKNSAWIRGGMRSAAIREETQDFNTGLCKVMLLQADAGKYGHTLIGPPDDPCGTMIFFENSYSLDTRSQIEDRIHRQGATAESCLYVDLAGSSYDAAVVAALQRKNHMFLQVFRESA